MDGMIWYEKYKDSPATKRFIQIFGGYFMINSEGGNLFWEPHDGSGKSYDMPEDETEFWNKVLKSVEQRKNLFIK